MYSPKRFFSPIRKVSSEVLLKRHLQLKSVLQDCVDKLTANKSQL